MDSPWLIAYLLLAGAAVVQAALLALQAWEHRRHGRICLENLDRYQPAGRALVLVPCKGDDVELEDNLRAAVRQDYPDYEVTFIVAGPEDPACPVIRRVMSEHPERAARLLFAGPATESGQKVHNLRAATADLPPEIRYLAFWDSDARPKRYWLRLAVGRLYRPTLGAATGYRWFVPQRPGLANHLLASLNCSVMALLGKKSEHFVWGGSWAIRRETFDRIGLREAWRGTLSDDLVACRVLRRAGLEVRFEPACVVASPVDVSLREMFAFLRRQYLITRHYVPGWWWLALATATVRSLAWLVSLGVVGWALLRFPASAWLPAAVLGLLYGLSVYRGWVMQDAGRRYFPDRSDALRGAARLDLWAGPLAGLVQWLGILSSAFGRHITWRGIRYRLDGRTIDATTITGVSDAASPLPHGPEAILGDASASVRDPVGSHP